MQEQEEDRADGHLYRAFISYSHSDKAFAVWLHKALERYHIPKKLVGKHTALGIVPKRLTPIFRDQDELPASGNLGSELHDALSKSLFLIVICSPASAQSKWVNEEIRQFKALHGTEKVLALIVDGIPHAKPGSGEQECFAPALKFDVSPSGELTSAPSEPIAADLRDSADGERLAKLKLVSGLTALRLDDLVQREATRRIRTLLQISAASTAAAVFAVGLAIYANDKRIEADAQRVIAEQESATSRAVSDFLVKTFANGSSVQKNPNAITARSILDRGAQWVGTKLNNQPLIQSRISATIARAYNNLGLFSLAIEIVDSTAQHSGVELASAYSIKAEALFRLGDIEASMKTANYAYNLAHQSEQNNNAIGAAKIRADIANIQALIHYQLGEFEAGLAAFERAFKELESMPVQNNVLLANTLQNRSLLLSDAGEMEWAAADLERAKVLVLASVGEQDIMYGQIALAQAQVNFLTGNLKPARAQIDTAISTMERILDSSNPTLADAYSMKGQILYGQGQLDEAKTALSLAVDVYTLAYEGRHYLSGIAEVYLGLIEGDQQNISTSMDHFDEAKRHYDASYGKTHPNHGDLLVNRATVLASAGEIVSAMKDCEKGMHILNDTLGEKAAFTQQLQAVCDQLESKNI